MVQWFPVLEAVAVIDDDDLRKLILQLEQYRRAVPGKYKRARPK
jgi:hypothetical protein